MLVLDCYERGFDLEDVFHTKSWRWFAVLVGGLLSVDSHLRRHFRQHDEPAEVDPYE